MLLPRYEYPNIPSASVTEYLPYGIIRSMTDQSTTAPTSNPTFDTTMYQHNDLSQLPIFTGGFINFGYWRDIPIDADISLADRLASHRAEYRLALEKLEITETDRVLEVGVGLGAGSVMALTEFGASEVYGIDAAQEQVDRAIAAHPELLAEEPTRLFFQRGDATDIPFPDDHFDKIFSVETAQHLDDVPAFIQEAMRVLRPGGRLVIATFFATASDNGPALGELLETFASGVNHPTHITTVLEAFKNTGISRLEVAGLGEHIWPGFDTWVAQTEYQDSWIRNWLPAYQQGLLNYYLISAS